MIGLAGDTVVYKSKYQDTVVLSSTEADFTAAYDAGRAILYVRLILDELNMPQDNVTPVYIGNNGAKLMANAQQPTKRAWHMDMKNFALLDWVQKDLLFFSAYMPTH